MRVGVARDFPIDCSIRVSGPFDERLPQDCHDRCQVRCRSAIQQVRGSGDSLNQFNLRVRPSGALEVSHRGCFIISLIHQSSSPLRVILGEVLGVPTLTYPI